MQAARSAASPNPRRIAMTRIATTLVLALLATTTHAASSPQGLAGAMQQALRKGDTDAVLASADLRGAPAMALFMLADLPNDCDEGATCTVTVKPLDAEWKAQDAQQMTEQGAEWGVAPEGLIAIETREPGPTGSSSSLQLPYAKVAGEYRIVIAHVTTARRAELEATTAQAATLKTLAGGIYDNTAGERDTTWTTTATPLAADGGEAGAAFLAGVHAMAAAIKANDPDAAAAAGGDWGRLVLGANDYAGKPIPREQRVRKLRSQAMRLIVEAKVLGGYRKGDSVVLVIEGRNGAGNIVRGAQIMDLIDGKWSDAGKDVIEVAPAGG
jgi:hypothetical protein